MSFLASGEASSALSLSVFQVVAIALVSLILSAFFSGSETGIMSISRVRLRRTAIGGAARIRGLEKSLRDIEDSILTCLIGTNLSNVAFSAVVTMALTEVYGARGEIIAVVVISAVVILFGEILPKVLFREYPIRLTVTAVPGLIAAQTIFWPLRWILRGYTWVWRMILPASEGTAGELDRRSLAALMLTNTVPRQDEVAFAHTLDRFLHLAAMPLKKIMRPLDQLVTVGPEATVGECLEMAGNSGFSRLPVTREDGQKLHGYLLVRDLIFLPRQDHELTVPRRLWRSFLFVDERMTPYEIFEDMRGQARQLAVVVDPGGNPLGMLSLEDLIETVMGSIQDEFDDPLEGYPHEEEARR